MLKNLLSAFILVFLFTGCLKTDNEFCEYNACAFVAPPAEVQAVEDYLAANNITDAVKHCSGLYYRIETPGTGKTPGICDYITIHYNGRLTNGTIFDQTTTAPATFQLNSLITGWKNGVPLIKQGGKITLFIPPSLGYGSQDYPPGSAVIIPGNSILIFEIELIQVS